MILFDESNLLCKIHILRFFRAFKYSWTVPIFLRLSDSVQKAPDTKETMASFMGGKGESKYS